MFVRTTVFICCLIQVVISQRVAPGVPPQQYNAPVHQAPVGNPNQQYQQQQYAQQQQYQQPPQVQYQQQPQHTQYQQQPQIPQQQFNQQAPVPHGHDHQHGAPQVLNANIQMEKEHIAEHMDVPIDTSKMSEQELQFHYFKMHDADNNNKLDGCELTKSLIHWHIHGAKEANSNPEVENKLFQDEELTNLIDPIMKMDDLNNDGYIDYPEFIRAQQKISTEQQQKTGN